MILGLTWETGLSADAAFAIAAISPGDLEHRDWSRRVEPPMSENEGNMPFMAGDDHAMNAPLGWSLTVCLTRGLKHEGAC
jgi:hypothetical protein